MLFRSIGLACLLAATAGIVRADDCGAYIVTPRGIIRPQAAESGGIVRPEVLVARIAPYRHDVLVIRPNTEPQTMREYLDQPTRPWLVEFRRAGNQVTYIDPYADYQHQGTGTIDGGNSLLAAQRLARTLLAPGAYVIHGSDAATPETGMMPTPALIFLKPDFLDRVSHPDPNHMTPIPDAPPDPTPASPARPDKSVKLMAESN